jgi:Kdo2-lipid IVA lauroyltransferase/acyltransferase
VTDFSTTRLFEARDVLRIPAWLLAKPAFALLPISAHVRLANLSGRVDARRSPLRRQVLTTLERHLGGKRSAEDLRAVARRHFQFRRRARFVRLWPEVRNFSSLESVEVEGIGHLDDALRGGKGAILVTAHFGYARLIKPILQMGGYDAALVGQMQSRIPSRHTRLGRFVHTTLLHLPSFEGERRARAVGADLPAGVNLRPHMEALTRNAVLVILADGRSAQAAIRVPVLGVDVAFAPGAVSLGRATGAPVLPAFVVDDLGEGGGSPFRLVIHPSLRLQRTGDAKADRDENLARFAAVYARQIQMHPHDFEWTWVRDGSFERGYEVFKKRPRPFVDRFRELVTATVPPNAVVLVVSRGYDRLLQFNGRTARHFPRDAGYLPRDGADAVRQLEAQRAQGATHLALPQPELWWLESYPALQDYLAEGEEVVRTEAGAIFALPQARG